MNRIAVADYLSEKKVSAEVQLVLSSKRRAKPEDQESALLRDQQQAEKVVSRCLPGSSVHAADGLGHFLLLEDPAYVAQLVRRFVSQS